MSIDSDVTEKAKPKARLGDRLFFGTSFGAGVIIMVTLAAVGLFLLAEGFPGLLIGSGDIDNASNFIDYVWPLVFGTLLSATIALIIAVPVSVGVALFISHYSPRKLGSLFGYVIDLLAAVPSVVYGAWGIAFLAPSILGFYDYLNKELGFLPFFIGPTSGRSIMTVSIVLALMILPIITAICREIFLQTPRLHQEAALALGATRWEMARLAIFPYARSGIVSASMLGLGRALGETMAVAMVLSITGTGFVTAALISSQNPSTIAANIALNFPEAFGIKIDVLIASGLVLFAITFAVNYTARLIVNRRKEFSGAN